MADYDLAIIGGGVNGCGIARDAAGRGARVLLVEQNDLASGTSSASTKLIHGGLRYLEHGAVWLVREALAERAVLLRMAPHIVRPMRFVLPAAPGPRASFVLRLGLFLYDMLGARKLLPAETIDLATHPAGLPLKRRFRSGFEYSDCTVDDARLVILNALDAAERGAAIRTRTRLVRAERDGEWRLILNAQGRRATATARVLVNAAGPWAGIVAETVLRFPGKPPIRLVKGSHIVVRKLFEHDRGYIFPLPEQRIVFALPFERDFTLIGTTNEDFSGNPEAVAPSSDEIVFLCRAASDFFRQEIGPEHVLWAFAGVRSLHDDGAGRPEDVTRDYHIVLDERPDAAPLLTVYGGKITTYRRLAEAALRKLGRIVASPPWTATTPLPGGDFLRERVETLVAQALRSWPFLDEANAARLVHAYGTRVHRIFGKAVRREEVGPWFGPLSAAEVRYLIAHEWARTAEDVLWRRSKLGLRLSGMDQEGLTRFMADELAR
jgi:glycerol-3-phosphate dehydrogenase